MDEMSNCCVRRLCQRVVRVVSGAWCVAQRREGGKWEEVEEGRPKVAEMVWERKHELDRGLLDLGLSD